MKKLIIVAVIIIVLAATAWKIDIRFFQDGMDGLGDPDALQGSINYYVWYAGNLF